MNLQNFSNISYKNYMYLLKNLLSFYKLQVYLLVQV